MANEEQLDAFAELVARYEELTRVENLVRGYRRAQKKAGVGAEARLNVWEGPGLLRFDEVSFCRVLAWFLDPGKEHDLGDRFLIGFLSMLGMKRTGLASGGTVTVNREYPQGNSRIDVLIKSKSKAWVVGIEAKVRSRPSLEQLQRYKKEYGLDGKSSFAYSWFAVTQNRACFGNRDSGRLSGQT